MRGECDPREAAPVRGARAPRRLTITPQPDDVTCGPACLHALYRHHGLSLPLERVIDEVPRLHGGGRLAVHMGIHALAQGFDVRLYTYNLEIFDPSWFAPGMDLAAKLRAQLRVKTSRRHREATRAYLAFLEGGGRVEHAPLTTSLLAGYLDAGRPLLAGVCATYLYGCPREVEVDERRLEYDDVRGRPTGHFVVLCDHDARAHTVQVADPLAENPRFASHRYEVAIERAMGAMLLGAFTWDANFLLVERPRGGCA